MPSNLTGTVAGNRHYRDHYDTVPPPNEGSVVDNLELVWDHVDVGKKVRMFVPLQKLSHVLLLRSFKRCVVALHEGAVL